MSNFVGWWANSSNKNQKKQTQTKRKPNGRQKFEDNWDSSLLDDQNQKSADNVLESTFRKCYSYFSKSVQNDEDCIECTDAQTQTSTCDHESSPKTGTSTKALTKIGTNDNLQNFPEHSEGNQSDGVNVTDKIKCTEAQGNESAVEARVVKLMEMDINDDSFQSTLDEMSYFSIEKKSEKNESRTKIDREMETNDKEADCVNVEIECSGTQGMDSGTSTQNESGIDSRVVKLMEIDLNHNSFLDVPIEMNCYDEPKENDSRTEISMDIGTNDKLQKFSEESEATETKDCVHISAQVGRIENGMQGTCSGTSIQDESKDQTRTEVLKEIEEKDNLQTFSRKSKENETYSVNKPTEEDRTNIQGSVIGPNGQANSEDETCNGKLMERHANSYNSLYTSDEETSKENEDSDEMEQSHCNVSRNSNLNNSGAEKKYTRKRQVSTTPIRRSSRLKKK